MDLTPGEKAVLGQIRVLYYNRAKREQQVKALRMLWPPTHHQTYESAFAGLIAKELISQAGPQFFKINDAGLRAMGIEIRQPPQVRQAVRQEGILADSLREQVTKKLLRPLSKLRGALSRLGVLRART